jgi:hypothetical protein
MEKILLALCFAPDSRDNMGRKTKILPEKQYKKFSIFFQNLLAHSWLVGHNVLKVLIQFIVMKR